MRKLGTSFRKPSQQNPAILLCADVIECEYAARGVTTQRSKGLLKRQGPALIECVENTPLRLPPPDYPGDCRALQAGVRGQRMRQRQLLRQSLRPLLSQLSRPLLSHHKFKRLFRIKKMLSF